MSSSKSFENLIVSTHNELCVKWRMEIVSCRENPVDINVQLNSLEQVMQAFRFGEFQPNSSETNLPSVKATSDLKPTVANTQINSKTPEPRPATRRETAPTD